MSSADVRQLSVATIQAWRPDASVVYSAIHRDRIVSRSWERGHGPYNAQPIGWLCQHIDLANPMFAGIYPFGGDGDYAGYWLMAVRDGEDRQVHVWREASSGSLVHSHRLVETARISKEALEQRMETEVCGLNFECVVIQQDRLNALRRLSSGYGGSPERVRQRCDAAALLSLLVDDRLPDAVRDALSSILADSLSFDVLM